MADGTGDEGVTGPQPRALVFVHLSDLHFRAGDDPLAEREAKQRDRLLQDIPTVVGLAEGKLEAILLTGDLARSGQKSEYDVARGWLDELCGLLNLHETSTLMCPGNHDVNWDILKDNLPRRMLNHNLRECPVNVIDGRIDELLTHPEFVLCPVEAYQEFAARCACDVTKRLAWELDEPIRFGDGYGLAIRGASTVINSDGYDRDGTMAVQTNQMIVTEQPGVVHMLLMHHSPPFWRQSKPGPGDLDNNIVLYGHTHTPDHRLALPSCLEITAGAVHPEENEFAVPSYNVIEISIDDTVQPADPAKAYAFVRVFRREFDRETHKFIEAGTDPTYEERVEVPRAVPGTPEDGARRDPVGPQEPDAAEGAGVSGEAEPQPSLETATGEPNPSRVVRAAFERLGSGERLAVLELVGLPVDEIAPLPPHRQIREVARLVVANGNVDAFLSAVAEIGGRS